MRSNAVRTLSSVPSYLDVGKLYSPYPYGAPAPTPSPAPVLSSPTESAITDITAIVSCTSDSGAGTLYWYISTSATPPSAADLKAGTGAVDFGNTATPNIGVNNFGATGLTASTTYYAYFIQNDGSNDSNLLGSGSWSTLPPAIPGTGGLNGNAGINIAALRIGL